MCIQGADPSVWTTPQTVVMVKRPPDPPPLGALALARVAVAFPLYLIAVFVFGLGFVLTVVLANKISGQRVTH